MTDDSPKTRLVIASLLTIAVCAIAVALMYRAVPEGSRESFIYLLGILSGALLKVVEFFFGTSAGAKTLSANQAAAVSKLTDAVTTTTPVRGKAPAGTPDDPLAVTEVDIDLTRRRSA